MAFVTNFIATFKSMIQKKPPKSPRLKLKTTTASKDKQISTSSLEVSDFASEIPFPVRSVSSMVIRHMTVGGGGPTPPPLQDFLPLKNGILRQSFLF